MTGVPHFLHALGRSQIAALVSGAVDFAGLFLFVELFHVWYVASTAIGAFLGAVTNFSLNRYWSFGRGAREGGMVAQAGKYALVSGGSLLINSLGVWYITEVWKVPYGISKVYVSLAVALFYNFPLHRGFVFR